MKFSKQFLQDMEYEVIEESIIDHSRWSVMYEVIFKHEDKFYVTSYSVGATEHQDETPYEYEPDEIECEEVFPVEVMTIKYLTKDQLKGI